VGVLGVAASLLLWNALAESQRTRFRTVLASDAAQERAAIQHRIEGQIDALESLARAWADFGRPARRQWVFETGMALDRFPGIDSVAWVDPSFSEVWAVERGPGRESVRFAERDPGPAGQSGARALTDTRMAGPFRGEDGSFHYRAQVPVGAPPEGRGALLADVDIGASLSAGAAPVSPSVAGVVEWDGITVFRHGTPADLEAGSWPGESGDIVLSPGVRWRAAHRPTPALASALISPLPGYVLGIGLLASGLLSAFLYEGGLARLRARELERSHRDLDRQVRETRGAEAALRDLNRELENRVRARTAALDDAVAELESFNYSVSHDLRSPLGAILNFTAILQEDYEDRMDGPGVDALRRIRASAESAMSMMDGLLELSRMGRAELRTRRVDMAQMARSCFEEAAAGGAGSEVRLQVDDLPPAQADPAMVRAVFTNLFRNAIKYTRDREKPEVRVAARSEGTESIYSVSDNGVGFDMRFADKLFRAFERLHSGEQFEGTGIGLAVVARIVQRHGGRVWAEGAPDGGASFFFSLPGARGAPS